MRRWLAALTVATLTALLWLAWSGSAQSQAEMSFVRLGALSVKAGAAGTLYFDEFVSKPQTYIGR
jgi:hypothetical protein